MTAVRYVVDAVVDRTGHCGREIWLRDGLVSLAVTDANAAETVRRPGFIVPGLRDAHLHLGSTTAATAGVTL